MDTKKLAKCIKYKDWKFKVTIENGTETLFIQPTNGYGKKAIIFNSLTWEEEQSFFSFVLANILSMEEEITYSEWVVER